VTVSGGYAYGVSQGSVTITAIYSGITATASLAVNSITPTGSAPTVTTNPATNITQTSASVSGSVTPNGASTSCWFSYGTTQIFGQTTAINSSVGSGGSNIPLNSYFSNLTPNTTYYFRATCQNSFGTSYGQTLSFTTQNSTQYTPSLTITPSSGSTGTGSSFKFTAFYDSDGASGPQSQSDVSYSANWSSSNNSLATVSSGGNVNGISVGSVTITAAYGGLTASANLLVVYGGGGAGNPPTVSTFGATNTSQNSATLNGQVNPNGFATTYWFEYGTSQSLGATVGNQSMGSGISSQNVSYNLSGLNSSATYYFRVSAQNQYGTSQGQILSFNTNSSGQPTLTLSQNSLTLNTGSGFQIQAIYDSDGPGPSAPVQVTSATSWNSSNASIATVSGGFINGVQGGSATITATYSGLSATVSVTVYGGNQGSAPVVQTTGATNISQNYATLNGSVNPNNSQTTYWFEYGTSYSLGYTVGNQSIGSGGGNQNVSYYVSGLNNNTVYYYRVVAQNQYGTIQGQILNFTTSYGGGGGGQAPIATTNYVGNQNQNSATLNGSVNPNGSQTNYWFEYGQNSFLGQTTGFQNLGSFNNSQSVSAQLYSLMSNTNYFYRVVAQNPYGTSYGSTYSFTTQGGGGGGNCNYSNGNQPCAQTNTPTNIGDTYATFNANVTPNGSDATVWFEYGINNYSFNYTTNNTFVQAYNTNYNVSNGVTGLTPASTYYVRVAAWNQYGTAYGQPYQFSTTGSNNLNRPSVLTVSANYISANSALLKGSVNPNGGVSSGWFEYGPTVSMGLRTNSQAVGASNNFVDISWALTGLMPATTYYYRAVGQTSAGTAYGSILSFRTFGYTPAPNPNPNPEPPIIINSGSCLSLNPTLNQPQVNSGDSVTYSLVYKNNCGYELQNTQLKIVLPLEASFTAANAAFANRDQNMITFNLGAVSDGYQGTLEVKNNIGSDVKSGATLLYGATAGWNNKAGRFFTTSAYISALVAGSVAGLASVLAIFGGWGWLWLLLLLLIAFAIYWIFFREDEKPTAKQKIEASIS
jgi:phosphodiesterase/alkaline phosphatase D-like protein